MAATRKKKPDDTAAYRQFRRELTEGTPRSLYVFHGEEAYLRAYYLDRLRAKLIPEGLESFNEHRFAGKDLTVRALAEAVDALPMMSERTLLVVQDYDLFKAPEAERTLMTELLSDLPDYCCLVFVYDTIEYKSDARMKKLTAALTAHGLVVPFRRQEKGDLIDWIRRRFRALGHSIDTADAEYLMRGPDDGAGVRDRQDRDLCADRAGDAAGHRRRGDPRHGRGGLPAHGGPDAAAVRPRLRGLR